MGTALVVIELIHMLCIGFLFSSARTANAAMFETPLVLTCQCCCPRTWSHQKIWPGSLTLCFQRIKYTGKHDCRVCHALIWHRALQSAACILDSLKYPDCITACMDIGMTAFVACIHDFRYGLSTRLSVACGVQALHPVATLLPHYK